MAQRNLAIRLSVTGAVKVKATLNDVGESGQRALKKVDDASRPASRALVALDDAAGEVRGRLESMTRGHATSARAGLPSTMFSRGRSIPT